MKRSKTSAAALVALVVLLLATAVGPALAAGSPPRTGRTPAYSRIVPPDWGVCVTRLGRPCPRPPVRVQ